MRSPGQPCDLSIETTLVFKNAAKLEGICVLEDHLKRPRPSAQSGGSQSRVEHYVNAWLRSSYVRGRT